MDCYSECQLISDPFSDSHIRNLAALKSQISIKFMFLDNKKTRIILFCSLSSSFSARSSAAVASCSFLLAPPILG